MDKSSPSPSPRHPHQIEHLAEIRKESSPTAITFSDPCPCCGNKKRRCLLPSPPTSRKKLLVVDLPTTAASPTPLPSPPPSLASSPSSVTQISDFIASRMPPTLQDSSSFTRRRCIRTSPPGIITTPAVTTPSTVIVPEAPQQAEIRDSGFFNWRRSVPTSPALQDSGSFKVKRYEPTLPAVTTPAELISPAAKKEPAEVIGPQSACEYDGGETSNWSASSLPKPVECSAEDDKRGGGGAEEFRVGLKCKCGIVSKFVLTR